MPYHGIITFILILAVLLLVAIAIMSYGNFAAGIRLFRLFGMYKCNPTKKLGSLWIDENRRKWSSKTADRLYDYSDILDYDIQLDGISMKRKAKLQGYGSFGEATAQRCKTFERIVVVVTVRDTATEYVNIPVGNSKTQEGSVEYQKYIKLANEICNELEKMKNNSN
ncbi:MULTISPECIES: hypothetical protein [unclassified Ruminococcus]|uniref:hypothetical protein n=1 Tax=unclassified Ruminococcus TaxID=2608920 RepID=UPI0021098751|nr:MULTISPECIES: hypothetical protein [unclassified Ruminococcus]MCQ4022623.1 hypothetical protein [Ruminococcus sp. zg-924]MCQ4114863.1 hypothetical protein [Ruminococcus sp. zg-921]